MIQHTRVMHKLALLGTVSTLALSIPAFAQSNGTASTGNVEQVVVTGSRIVENGYQAPTPVTVATSQDLALSSPTSISYGLTKLPQFVGSNGPQSRGTGSAGNILDLRGLGNNRTLILLNGTRVPPTSYLNQVDVDILPQLLIQRVDVVTGGASASYGSDAVAGVVNYVLDTKFSGIKGQAQTGVSTFGDGHNERFSLAAGTDLLGGRGHLLVSTEYAYSGGYTLGSRPKLYNIGEAVGSVVGSTAAAGSKANPYVQVDNVRANFATYGGYATSGPFALTNFYSPGVYGPLQSGAPTGTIGVYKAPSDYIGYPPTTQGRSPSQTMNFFGRFNYDLDDDTTAYVQLMGAQANMFFNTLGANFLALPGFTIFSGNAFLPAPLQSQLSATNTASFGMAKLMTELGPPRQYERLDNYSEQVGANGKLGRFAWNLEYSHGASIDTDAAYNLVNFQNFYAAVDAVVNPGTGLTVCAPSLSANAAVAARYASCVPYNSFGYNAGSPASKAYITGTSRFRAENTENDISGNIAGRLFDLPAGPLSAVLGGEYRTANLNVISNANPGTPPDFTGERGVNVNSQFYLLNQANAKGAETVEEGFAELAIPVVKDLPFIQALDVNAAARVTNYSITGEATTWKVGATWKIYDDLTLRATRSRDIRAPTLYDLYAGQQAGPASATDPHTGITTGWPQVTSGNPNLKPEVGNTFTGGFVYQSSWLEGFALSLDYYRVNMSRAITTLSTVALLADCEASGGSAPSCANIIRPLPFADRTSNNLPTQTNVSGINAAAVHTQGVDLDASYKTDLFGGELTARTYLTYVAEFATQLTNQQPLLNYSGWNAAGSGGVAGAIPDFKGTVSLNYEYGDYGIFVQEDMVGGLKLGPALGGGTSGVYVNPQLPAYGQTDITLTYKSPQVWGLSPSFFFNVTNVFNATAPIVDTTVAPGTGFSTITSLYDTTGRAFVVGVRFGT